MTQDDPGESKWPPYDFSDCINTGPMMGEVGYIGDIDELREYPCNCTECIKRYEEALEASRPNFTGL